MKASSAAGQKPSYASIVSKSISESVKQVVTETIQNSDNKIRDKVSVMFYGLLEKKQDFQDVSSVLQSISINCSPLQCIRLGRNANGQKAISVRLLKVILNSEANKEIILRTAKKLKESKTFSYIRIARFLNKEKQEKEKATRAH